LQPKALLDYPAIRTRFGNGTMPDWEFEKAGRTVKVSPPAKLIASYRALAMQAALDGVGFWMTFEGYVRDAVKSGALESVLDDWLPPFPGPFLLSAAAGARRVRGFCRGMAQAGAAQGQIEAPHSMLGSTRSGGLWLSRKVRILIITFSPISTRPSIVAEPICGSSVTLPARASRTSFGFTAGSCSNTSRPAPAISPLSISLVSVSS